jgi:hypothetical protein
MTTTVGAAGGGGLEAQAVSSSTVANNKNFGMSSSMTLIIPNRNYRSPNKINSLFNSH